MTATFRIRDARRQDANTVGEQWKELIAYHRRLDVRFASVVGAERDYARHVLRTMRSADGRALVAEETASGRIVGYLLCDIQKRSFVGSLGGTYGFIADLYVEEAWRRQGVGKALALAAHEWFKVRNARAIELYAAAQNPTAVAFWRSLGMEPFLHLMHKDL